MFNRFTNMLLLYYKHPAILNCQQAPSSFSVNVLLLCCKHDMLLLCYRHTDLLELCFWSDGMLILCYKTIIKLSLCYKYGNKLQLTPVGITVLLMCSIWTCSVKSKLTCYYFLSMATCYYPASRIILYCKCK